MPTLPFSRPADVELNAGQRTSIEQASDAPLMVLTGGPGCGKTTAVQTIVKLWAAQRKVVRLCAPTGRAAQRMGRISGVEPCTIHRLLRYTPAGEGGAAAATSAADAASEEARLGEAGHFEFNRRGVWALLAAWGLPAVLLLLLLLL